jgi:hypothetical protein
MIRWGNVCKLKRVAPGLIFMDSDSDWFILFSLPIRVVNGLLAILREATNARIIGFD